MLESSIYKIHQKKQKNTKITAKLEAKEALLKILGTDREGMHDPPTQMVNRKKAHKEFKNMTALEHQLFCKPNAIISLREYRSNRF